MTDYFEKNALAIDCSSSDLRLGLRFGHDRIVKLSVEAGRRHGELMIEKIADLLRSAEIEVENIEAIVVCIGPGSFTGLRIALAAAKGMATSLNIPVVGVSLFEVAAFMLRGKTESVLIVVPFKRDAVFVGRVKGGDVEENSIKTVATEQLTEVLAGTEVASCGFRNENVIKEIESLLTAGKISFDAGELLEIGVKKLNEGKASNLENLEPLYIQKSQAEIRLEQTQRNQS